MIIKIVLKEWECKKVEYDCYVDDDEFKKCKDHGIGYFNDEYLGTDDKGYNARPMSRKVINGTFESRLELANG